jgi:hypothetical protein
MKYVLANIAIPFYRTKWLILIPVIKVIGCAPRNTSLVGEFAVFLNDVPVICIVHHYSL